MYSIKTIIIFFLFIYIINTRDNQAQAAPDAAINIHFLTTQSNYPDMVKLGNIVIDDSRRRAYFTANLSRFIGIIDLDSMKVIDTVDTRMDGFLSRHLFINTQTGTLYMFIIETNQLYRINPDSNTVSSPVQMEGAAIDPGTDHVFAASPPNQIKIYDGRLQYIGAISNVIAPGRSYVDASRGRLYVVNSVVGSQGGVSVYNTSTLQFIQKYNMPSGFNGLPSDVHSDYGKIYVYGKGPGTTKTLSIIDENTGSGSLITINESVTQMRSYQNKLYLMTGYSYYAGYLPNGDGAYGITEVRDPITGVKLTDLWCDLETLYFDIDRINGRLYYSATGRGVVGIVRLSDYVTLRKIDVATTIEDILVSQVPGMNGDLYLRNRLGGSTIYRINPVTGTLVGTLIPGNWPTKILMDSSRNRMYALVHYEAKISVFDISTDSLLYAINLGTQKARTDALSIMAMNHSLGKLYAVTPELGKLTMVNADGSGTPLTISIEGFTPDPLGGGPGKLHIAVNESLNRVYVFIKDVKRLNIYDGSSLSLISYSTITQFNQSTSAMDLLYSDAAGNRLFVGPHIVNPTTGNVTGQIPTGQKLVAINPLRNKHYVFDFYTTGFNERIYEYDSSFQTIVRQWNLARINGVYSTFGFDFVRGKMYVGYFDRGVVEVFNIGGVTSVDDFQNDNSIPKDFMLYQNYPNPFNPSTTIRFSLPQSAHVVLKVFDVLGREVATLLNGELNPGEHSVAFDATNLSSGVYVYQLSAGGFIQTKKMLVAK